LVAAVAPAMKRVSPGISIYATGNWRHPEQFGTMREAVGSAWSAVDGLSIHGYCSFQAMERLCSRIADIVDEIRSASGKDKIYDSEWSAGDAGIRNANEMIVLMGEMARSRIVAAAYWPPVKAVTVVNFVSADFQRPFATGLAFGWMSRYYEGRVLAVRGDLPAVAAENDGGTTIIVPTHDSGPRTVRVDLTGTGLSKVKSAEVLWSRYAKPAQSRFAQISPLPVDLLRGAHGDRWMEFSVNPGGPDRGSNWEIARVTLE
jgi:hypothetical protein